MLQLLVRRCSARGHIAHGTSQPPRACARGKAIAFVIVVVVHTKSTTSRDLDVLVSGQWCQDIESGGKVMSFCF